MPANVAAPYRRSLSEARSRGEDFRRATRHVDGRLFRERIAELASSVTLEAGDSHLPDFIAVLTEVAVSTPEVDRGDARAFAAQFTNRPADYSRSRAGLAAIQFEAWLIEHGGALYGQFVETVLDGDARFLAIFEGPLTQQDEDMLRSGVSGFARVKPLVEAGAVSYSLGEIMEFTMFDCEAVGKGKDVRPVELAKPGELSMTFASASESIAPSTQAQYARVSEQGGISKATAAFLFPRALREAALLEGQLQFIDGNGVAWCSPDGGRWLPNLSTLVEHLCEEVDGALRSKCGAWTVFPSRVLEEGVQRQATVIVVGESAWTTDEPGIESAVRSVLHGYRDLPAEGDAMVEALLRDIGRECGRPCANPMDVVESVRVRDDRPTRADRDYEIAKLCAMRRGLLETETESDASRVISALKAAFTRKAPGKFSTVTFDARFGTTGQVFVRFANVPSDADHLDVLNATIGFVLSIGMFDRSGAALGKLKAEMLTGGRSLGWRGKTASVDVLVAYVERFIAGLPLDEADDEEDEDPEAKPKPKGAPAKAAKEPTAPNPR